MCEWSSSLGSDFFLEIIQIEHFYGQLVNLKVAKL